MRRLLSLLLLLAMPAPAQETLFTFHNGFWLNLHHFLYVLGRARIGTPDSRREAVKHAPEDVEGMDSLDKPELLAWDAAITYYREHLSSKDTVFDADLVAISRALATGRLDVPSDLRAVLERAEPVYRKVWWPRHEQANRSRIAALELLLRAHGAPVAKFVSNVWKEKWPPDGRVVEMSAYSSWAGAYSTDGGLIVMASLDRAIEGSAGLEILFHEAMHQWDDDFQASLAKAAAHVHTKVPPALSHSLIFYTAGYAVAAEMPSHKPYADTNGLWERGMFSRQKIATEWTPYLQGQRTMEDAMERLLTVAQ